MRWYCLLVLAVLGCAGEGPRLIQHPDASLPVWDAGAPPPPCTGATDVSADFQHCGSCVVSCSPADADRCFLGLCFCGSSLVCEPGSDCRNGHCILQDPRGRVCEFDRECWAGYVCVEGRCSFMECLPEQCDGYDNDCDGVIDNTRAAPLSSYCLGDFPVTPGYVTPPCSIGTRVCVAGTWGECLGDVAPQEEAGLLGCDGVDNDCDGCADGVMSGDACTSRVPAGFDVLFFLDTSGSMTSRIELVRAAVHLFSARLSSPLFSWGSVRVPGPVDGTADVYRDLTTLDVFTTSLELMPRRGGGTENQWDAVVDVLNGNLRVTWTPGATKIFILFTDEEGQTSYAPRQSETSMCDAVVSAGVVWIPVVAAPYQVDFDACAHRSVPLPAGVPGSLRSCAVDADCPGSSLGGAGPESCGEGRCVSVTVVDLVDELELVIDNPCE